MESKNYARFLLDTGLGTEIITRLTHEDIIKLILDGRAMNETFITFQGIEAQKEDEKAYITVENKRIVAVVVRKLAVVEAQQESQAMKQRMGLVGG